MCTYFDPNAVKQCLEDDAEEVIDKTKVNFCEWFKPGTGAFDPVRAGKEARAKGELEALFGGESDTNVEADPAIHDAEKLFK